MLEHYAWPNTWGEETQPGKILFGGTLRVKHYYIVAVQHYIVAVLRGFDHVCNALLDGTCSSGQTLHSHVASEENIRAMFALLLLLLNIKDFHHPSQVLLLLFHKFATIISFLGLVADIQIFMFRFGHCSQSTVSIFSPELSQRHPGWEVFGGAQQWRDLQMECVSCERAAHENRARHFHNSLRVVKLET